jgi:hypothetical protein
MQSKNEEREVPDPKISVRTVCRACNNGWMSTLEEANIPLVGNMFQDVALQLDRDQQTLVSRWVAKTAMMFDSARPKQGGIRYYIGAESSAFRATFAIPPRTRIWLGRLDTKHLHAGGTDFLYKTQNTDLPMVLQTIFTIVAGHFIAQIVSQRALPGFQEDEMQELSPKPGDWDNKLIQIWPVSRDWIMWPPERTFTNGGPEGIGYLGDRWRIGEQVDQVKPFGAEGNSVKRHCPHVSSPLSAALPAPLSQHGQPALRAIQFHIHHRLLLRRHRYRRTPGQYLAVNQFRIIDFFLCLWMPIRTANRGCRCDELIDVRVQIEKVIPLTTKRDDSHVSLQRATTVYLHRN